MKTCRLCETDKPEDEFPLRETGRRRSECRDCLKAKSRARYERNREEHKAKVLAYQRANPEKVRAWRKKNKGHWDRKGKYGLDRETYAAMLIAQAGRCGICGEPMTSPCVDHCHDTSKVRGLLCGPCNTGLGHFRDDPARLAAAIEYLTT